MRAALLLIVALVGCNDLGYAVGVTLDVDPALTDEELARVQVLELEVTGAHETRARHQATSALRADRGERFVYRPAATSSGTVTIRVLAEDADGVLIARAEVSAKLTPGATSYATLTLVRPASDFGSSDGGVSPDLAGIPAVTPLTVTLCPGQQQTFTLDRKVTVTMLEASAGTISQTGAVEFAYTAPAETGVFHLRATDPANSATVDATITIACLGLLAGEPVSPGSTDANGGAARFGSPQGLTAEPNGDLLIADTDNHTIRRYSRATGEVSTIVGLAGHPGNVDDLGTAARINAPQTLALDGLGSAYIADAGNCKIRKLDLATRNVTTLVGGPPCAGEDGDITKARFDRPTGITVADSNTIYVADFNGYTLRRITLSPLSVTTVAGAYHLNGNSDGNGNNARFSGPWGVGLIDGYIYIADRNGHVVRRYDPATGDVSTLAGAAGSPGEVKDGSGLAARFSGPTSIAPDGNGHLIVAERFGYVVRSIDLASKAVTTIVGTPLEDMTVLGPLPGRLFEPYAAVPTSGGRIAILSQNAIVEAVLPP